MRGRAQLPRGDPLSRLLARIQRQRLAEQQARAVRRALMESEPAQMLAPRSAAGDEQRLRMIPAVGGAPGAIPGTRPGC